MRCGAEGNVIATENVAGDGFVLVLSADKPVAAGSGRLKTPGKLRVFIVEDELFVAWDLESTVQSIGHEVCGMASTAEEAIRGAIQAEPDVVLTDINLGQSIDGIEAARRILLAHRAAVIFVTAYTDSATLVRAAEAVPGSTVIGKPVSEKQLNAAMAAANLQRN